MKNLDHKARQSYLHTPNTTISWFLAASYAYYMRFESILSDECFDGICKYIRDNFEKLEHPHKHLLSKEMLEAGTAYNLTYDQYPTIVVVTAEEFIKEVHDV